MLVSDLPNPNWDAIQVLLQLFFPQFSDPDDPSYIDPIILAGLDLVAMNARPWCLSEQAQNLAEMWYLAYLVSLRKDTSSGTETVAVAGPIVSEKEGDISVTYADLSSSGKTNTGASTKPPSDPYDQWKLLWDRCGVGSITTRYGDPVKKSMSAYQTNLRLLSLTRSMP
jgi:hypothetical protein